MRSRKGTFIFSSFCFKLHDYHTIVDKVTCPKKYILKGLINPEYKEVVLKEQKGARFIAEAGHMMNIEKPDEFNQVVDELVQEILKE